VAVNYESMTYFEGGQLKETLETKEGAGPSGAALCRVAGVATRAGVGCLYYDVGAGAGPYARYRRVPSLGGVGADCPARGLVEIQAALRSRSSSRSEICDWRLCASGVIGAREIIAEGLVGLGDVLLEVAEVMALEFRGHALDDDELAVDPGAAPAGMSCNLARNR